MTFIRIERGRFDFNNPLTGLQVQSSIKTFLHDQYWGAVFDQRTRFCCVAHIYQTHPKLLWNWFQTFMRQIWQSFCCVTNFYETDLPFLHGVLSRRAMIGVSSIQKNRIQLISLLKVWGLWKIGNDQCISIFLAPKLKFFTTTKKSTQNKRKSKVDLQSDFTAGRHSEVGLTTVGQTTSVFTTNCQVTPLAPDTK